MVFNRHVFATDGKGVVMCPPVNFGCTTFSLDPPSQKEPLQGGVKRAFSHLEHVVRHLLQVLGDAISVHRSADERPEDQQVERARKQFRCISCPHRLSMGGWRRINRSVK